MYLILLAFNELGGLIMMLGGYVTERYHYMAVGLLVFGFFRWRFNVVSRRVEREYKRRFR
jgi:hypothetical protein